ncbi:MAG: SWIM zinc finger family protein, partial [Christensenellaceae bacterium]|nr:SWIM zinc finger family protein [Christensenellaceae bacterium]
MPFNNNYLLSKAISKDAFDKALEISDSNHVKVISNNFNKVAKIYNLQTIVTGDRENYNTNINFSLNKKLIYNFKCDCPAAKNYKGACKHVLASIIYVSKALEYKQTLPIVEDIDELKEDYVTSPNLK